MKWPLVSRFRFDALAETNARLASKAADADRLREQNLTLNARALAVEGALERQNARYDALLEKYHAIKIDGGTITPPVTPLERKERDPLDEALTVAMQGVTPALRRAAMQQLARDRKAIEAGFTTVEEVLARIQRGVPQEEGVPV